MSTLPSQDAPLPPPQQPYIAGQQPMYQQVSASRGCRRLGSRTMVGLSWEEPVQARTASQPAHAATHTDVQTTRVLSPVDTGRELLGSPLGQDENREPTTRWEEGGLAWTGLCQD